MEKPLVGASEPGALLIGGSMFLFSMMYPESEPVSPDSLTYFLNV